MPRKQKQRQKQKQEQKQYVVVNVHEKKSKKRKPNRKKKSVLPPAQPVVLGLPKVPPIVVQYTEPASLGQPPPPKSAVVIGAEPVKPKVFNEPRKILAEPDWVKPVAKAPASIKIEKPFVNPVRPPSDVLRKAPPSLDDLVRQAQPARPVDVPQYQAPAEQASGGGAVRYPRPRSHGKEIPIEQLKAGNFGETAGGKKRTAPTSAQKKILEQSGYSGNPPWK